MQQIKNILKNKTPLKIKICCIQSFEEAEMAIQHGATDLGFVSEMPSGPGVISEENIAKIIKKLPPAINSVLLTSKRCADDIIAQQKRCKANAIQLCDHLEKSDYAELKAVLPEVSLIHVIHVNGEADIAEALEMQNQVDLLLLDSGSKTAEVKVLGGTGRTHDWSISKTICERASIPVFLAGGLKPDNVVDAVHHVCPDGVDICTGVRTDWVLDAGKLENFMKALKSHV